MTLARVRTTTDVIRGFRALPFMLVAGVSLLGAFYRPAPQAVTGGPLNSGDVTWMLTATGMVLLMTRGIGTRLSADEKRAHLEDIRRAHLIDEILAPEILPPERH